MEFDCGDQCAAGPVGRLVNLDQAVGLVLAHDMTEIIPGQSKAPAFKKGHVVRPEDLERLARMGKRHLYVLDIAPDQMHENEAAEVLAQALSGPGIEKKGPPSEGKIVLIAAHDGLFQLDPERLTSFNLGGQVMCATIHRHSVVNKGQELAGTRAIPLVVERQAVEEAAALAAEDGGLLKVLAFRPLQAGVVVTGNEVAHGLIEDRFAPIVTHKLEALGAGVMGVEVAPDDKAAVTGAIKSLLRRGAEIIITTAGMSVDPDDVTRMAIADAGGKNLLYGAPVLPGAMFLVGDLDGQAGDVPILGVPACALFHPTTILDLILPRVLTGERFTRASIAALAHGGFCQNCADGCRFPVCGFGRGN
ncbi:MAG: molybdopterin-binding protein [Desulfarculaceae bacterium]|nr:molybdopterin-binding protein [Desulfarculaceae bacterium]MCF8073924.1 molybdopterin-binding protein [Desulfarculaceae bacterium]MCF8102610.1 molybdopterin-binding protein [Desulfarculaceae bacterium]MCF8117621.1 molybdopterin-binding protein [Desulfarculaceae bacterium]